MTTKKEMPDPSMNPASPEGSPLLHPQPKESDDPSTKSENPARPQADILFELLRDGQHVCFGGWQDLETYLHDHHSCSIVQALKFEGFRIVAKESTP